jgi:hypothetical protein
MKKDLVSTEILDLLELTRELTYSKTLSPECIASLKFTEFGLYQAFISQQNHEIKRGKKMKTKGFGFTVKIVKSKDTNNHLIMLNHVIFDSALRLSDAKKVEEWLKNAIKLKSLPDKWWHPDIMNQWRESLETQPPVVDAEMFLINRMTGKVEKVRFLETINNGKCDAVIGKAY